MPSAKGKSRKHPYDGMVCDPSPENLPAMVDGTCYRCRKVGRTKRIRISFVKFGRGDAGGMASEQATAYVMAPLCSACRGLPFIHDEEHFSNARLAKAAAEFRAWDRKAQRFVQKKKPKGESLA